jgi:hypothetical protein
MVLALLPWATANAVLAAESNGAPPPDPRQVQAAVAGGLRWLAEHQVREGPDAGSWESHNPAYRAATASLAGLALLANGNLPGEGEYGENVQQAMRYVMATMTPDGYLGQGDRSGMYIHAICSLFGLSYLGMAADPEREPELAEWCRKSVGVIVEAQQIKRQDVARGGWRYTPYTDDSDVSVTSWQLLVLHAARQCGYNIDDAVTESALRYVNRAYVELPGETPDSPSTPGFLYHPGVSQSPEPAVTGVAVFIKSLLERGQDERIRSSLGYLERFPPTWGGPQYGGYFFFASFYMTQGMFQVGDETWAGFSPAMQRVLLDHQAGDGHWPFPPDNAPQSRLAGDAYPTAMALLVLSLDKQYLPMYQRQKQMF